MKAWILAVAMLLAAGALGYLALRDGDDPAAVPAPPSVTVTSTTTVATTTTMRVATVRQYAAVIAEHESGVRSALASAKPCLGFSADCTNLGSIGMLTLNFSAESLVVHLEGVAKSTSPTFLGDPPQEIAALYNSTLKAARDVVSSTNGPCDAKACDLGLQASFAASRLANQLDAWRAFI